MSYVGMISTFVCRPDHLLPQRRCRSHVCHDGRLALVLLLGEATPFVIQISETRMHSKYIPIKYRFIYSIYEFIKILFPKVIYLLNNWKMTERFGETFIYFIDIDHTFFFNYQSKHLSRKLEY